MTMKAVLSIAGSDSSGGAGIQADIKTIAAHGLFAETVITALTAQNTTRVYGDDEVEPAFVAQQIDAVFEDIRPSAVKIGMVSSAAIVHTIAERLRFHGAENIVVDPVMVATSGADLMQTDAVRALVEELLPLATVVTPNIPEAEVLSGVRICSREDMEAAGLAIYAMTNRAAVLVKGGHALPGAENSHRAADLLITKCGEPVWLPGERINTSNTHGTGCTLSSAIACGIADSKHVRVQIINAKEYVAGALRHDPHLGCGNGPLDHMWSYRAAAEGSASE